MRKIIVYCSNSKSVGCDSHEALLVDDNATAEEIDSIAWEMSVEHAGSYFDVVEGYEDDHYNDSEISMEEIEASWEDYVPKTHDMYRSGGGSFEDDFK